jgi:signal recognition particle receptor subunit beta
MANKHDHADAISPDAVAEKLKVKDVCCNHKWNVVATDGIRGSGVAQAIEWLTQAMPPRKKK